MGVPGILVGCAAAALLARGVLAGAPEGAVAGKPARAGQHDVLFVANVVDGTITLIDTQSLERLGALNAIPDGKHVYNGSLGIASPELPGSRSGPKQLTVADAKTLEVVRILPFERGVRPFAFTPNGSLLYVQFSDGDGFSEVNPVTGAILRTK